MASINSTLNNKRVTINPTPINIGVPKPQLPNLATDSNRTSNSSKINGNSSKNVTSSQEKDNKDTSQDVPYITRLLELLQPISSNKRLNLPSTNQHQPEVSSTEHTQVGVAPVNATLSDKAYGSRSSIWPKKNTLRMLSEQFVQPILNIFKRNKPQGKTNSSPLVISEKITNETVKALEQCSLEKTSLLRKRCVKNVLTRANWHLHVKKFFDWDKPSKEEAPVASSIEACVTRSNNAQHQCTCVKETKTLQLLATTNSSNQSETVSVSKKQNSVAELNISSKAPAIRSYLDDFLSHIDNNKHPKCSNCSSSATTSSNETSCKSCLIDECVKLLQLYTEHPKKQKIVIQVACKFLVNPFTWKQVQPIIAPIATLLVGDASSVPLFNISRYFFQIIKRKQSVNAKSLAAITQTINKLRKSAFVLNDDRLTFVRSWIVETLHSAEDCFDYQQQQRCHTFLNDCGLQPAPTVTFSPSEEEQRYCVITLPHKEQQAIGKNTETYSLMQWNVNGLIARWNTNDDDKGFKRTVANAGYPTVIGLTETKCTWRKLCKQPDSFSNWCIAHGYYYLAFYWTSVTVNGKHGYAGVAILSKIPFNNTSFGVDDELLDQHARVIHAEFEEFQSVCTYSPNSGGVESPRGLDKKLLFTSKLATKIMKVKQARSTKPVIAFGDYNCAPRIVDWDK